MSGYPSLAEFAAQTGTVFTSAVGGVPLDFTLVGVREGVASEDYVAFSLDFEATGADGARQGTYALSHDVLGTHEIFLVPVSRAGGVTRFEASFNVTRKGER